MKLELGNWFHGRDILSAEFTYFYVVCEFQLDEPFGMYVLQCESTSARILDKHTFGSYFEIFPILKIHHFGLFG